jgi:hypothetical protein
MKPNSITTCCSSWASAFKCRGASSRRLRRQMAKDESGHMSLVTRDVERKEEERRRRKKLPEVKSQEADDKSSKKKEGCFYLFQNDYRN